MPRRDVLLLDETLVFCDAARRIEYPCIRSIDIHSQLPHGGRTTIPMPVGIGTLPGLTNVPHARIAAILHLGSPDVVWKRFYDVFPNASGFAGVSAPVYNNGAAPVYVMHSYGGLGGKGWIVRVMRDSGGWRAASAHIIWVS